MRICKLLFICLLVVTALPVSAQPDVRAAAKPIIIDTDMAVDDWMAILYLLQRTDVNVLALTIAGTGEARCNPGIQNAMNLVALAGNPDVPVACGRETPLKGSNTFPKEWRDSVDAMNGLTLAKNPKAPGTQDAVALLRQVIKQSSEQVTLVTLGPLTNIAGLVQADPAVVAHIKMIYVMGGAVEVPGNLQGGAKTDNTTAEWNIYVDPLAAAQVVEAGVPVTFVPLDATNHAPLTMAFYKKLENYRTTPEAEFVYRAVTSQIGFAQSGGWYFWDPMAAVTASDESVVTIKDRTVRIVTDEGREFGRIAPDAKGKPVRVAMDANVNRFEQLFLNVLNGREPLAALPESAKNSPTSVAAVTTAIESAADIIGTWRWQTASFHLLFQPDGSYRADESLVGLHTDSPEDLGTYQVQAGILTTISGKTSRYCRPGDAGVYKIYLTAAGQLALVLQKDACTVRNPPSTAPQLFDPINPEGVSLAFPTGTFIGNPYTMTLNSDGTYTFGAANGQVITTGTFAIKANTLRWINDTFCHTSATYHWAYQNNQLSFTLIGADACADRLKALTTITYSKR